MQNIKYLFKKNIYSVKKCLFFLIFKFDSFLCVKIKNVRSSDFLKFPVVLIYFLFLNSLINPDNMLKNR